MHLLLEARNDALALEHQLDMPGANHLLNFGLDAQPRWHSDFTWKGLLEERPFSLACVADILL